MTYKHDSIKDLFYPIMYSNMYNKTLKSSKNVQKKQITKTISSKACKF